MDECKPLPSTTCGRGGGGRCGCGCVKVMSSKSSTDRQGLTFLDLSAQRKHLLWDTLGGFRVSVTETDQVELRNGRVYAPADRSSRMTVRSCSDFFANMSRFPSAAAAERSSLSRAARCSFARCFNQGRRTLGRFPAQLDVPKVGYIAWASRSK